MSAATGASPKMGDVGNVDIDGDLDELKHLSIPLTSPVQITSYLNERFPTQSALMSNLEEFSSKLSAAESRLDMQLATLMRMHCHDTTKTTAAITETDAAVESLRKELLVLMKSTSRAQENMENALKPAMPVYMALQNVSATLDALDAIVNLEETVRILEQVIRTSDLSILVHNKNNTIQVLDSSLSALNTDDTRKIRGVGPLRSRALVAREGLRASVLNAFKLHSDAVSNMDSATTEKHTVAVETLRSACQVAEMMGPEVKAEVIGAFVRRRRASLRAAFSTTERSVKVLSDTERRFAWVRRELRTHWAHLGGERINRGWGRVFPSEWFVAKRVADGLIAECRDVTAAALDSGAHHDVDTMIIALAKAKEFETELNRRFEIIPTMETNLPSSTQSGVNSPPVSSQAQASFIGAISDCFGPWMDAFVSHEENQLGSTLSQLVRDETWQSEYDMNAEKSSGSNVEKLNNTGKTTSTVSGATTLGTRTQLDKLDDPFLGGADRTAAVVLKSATELFLAIKKSMCTCASLDVRQPLFSLHRVFRKHLATYASVLVRHLPGVRGKNVESTTVSNIPLSSGSSSSSSDRATGEFEMKIIKACAIINTAHYCAVTTEQLEERVRETIAVPFKTDVDLSAERERFGTVCARGIQAVVALTEENVDIHLRTISTRDWSQLSEVGDTSLYIDETGRKLTATVHAISRRLSKTHLRFLLEKLASAVIGRVRTHIYRCADSSSAGAATAGTVASSSSSATTSTLSSMPSEAAAVAAAAAAAMAMSTSSATSSNNTRSGTHRQSGGISSVAAQQLLLDVTSLRGILVGLPSSVHAATATTFVKLVNRDIGRVEAILKVILAPLPACVDTYVALLADHGSAPDLQRILDIRGLKRADAAPLILDYSRRIAPSQRLRAATTTTTATHSASAHTHDGNAGVGVSSARATTSMMDSQVRQQRNVRSNDNDDGTTAAMGDVRRVRTAGADEKIGGSSSSSMAASSTGNAGTDAAAAVDTVKNLFGRIGNSLIETGLTDRLEQVSSQFESTTDQLKKGVAASRWNLFGGK